QQASAEGASVPTCPSPTVNQYRLDEDEEQLVDADVQDLLISVDEPESHVTTIETFITYRVVTKTTRSDFDCSEYQVHRRYQDFLWLRSRLEESSPTLIVHPLPEKFVVKGLVERFSADFIETRRRALQRFLARVAQHPLLSRSQHLRLFLTAPVGELQPHKKQGAGLLSRMGETVRAVAGSLRGPRSRPEEFTLMHRYLEEFGSKISSVDKISRRISREQREYLEELRRCAPSYSLWAGLEEELAEPLRGVATCVERCCLETEHIQHLTQVLVPVHEYVLGADTAKAVMRRRDVVHADYEVKNEALALQVCGGDSWRRRWAAWRSVLELANSALKEDWCRWQDSRRTDLRSAFLSAADGNIQYYQKCLAVWESFLLSQ
uniref:Sorting nexin 7 n=1 Tax=Tetraodon nigroviridis TaxID=99883 RepID=H3CG47_TETNG